MNLKHSDKLLSTKEIVQAVKNRSDSFTTNETSAGNIDA